MGRLVDRVVFDKHPLFKIPREVARPMPGRYGVGITGCAYGYFDMTYTVYFHKHLGLKPLKVVQELHFEECGRARTYTISVCGK